MILIKIFKHFVLAKALNISRIAFLEMLQFYNVSIFNDADIQTIIADKNNA